MMLERVRNIVSYKWLQFNENCQVPFMIRHGWADGRVVLVIANVLENHVGIWDDCLDAHSIFIQFLYHWPASRISVQQLHIYSMLLSSLDIYAWATCLLSLIQAFSVAYVLLFFFFLHDHKTKASFPTQSNKLFFILLPSFLAVFFVPRLSLSVCLSVFIHVLP